jgi:hypothetical protein
MEVNELLEDGTVVSAHRSSLVVEVEGVEVHVSPRVKHRSCSCCGDSERLHMSYNRLTEDRIEKHGEADPLNIE